MGSRWLADPEDPQTFRMKKGATWQQQPEEGELISLHLVLEVVWFEDHGNFFLNASGSGGQPEEGGCYLGSIPVSFSVLLPIWYSIVPRRSC